MSEWVDSVTALVPAGVRWVATTSLLYVLIVGFSPGPLAQAPVTFLFILTCPGALMIDWIEFSNRSAALITAVVVSIAINTIIATLLIGAGAYTPDSGLVATAAVSACAAVASSLGQSQGIATGGYTAASFS